MDFQLPLGRVSPTTATLLDFFCVFVADLASVTKSIRHIQETMTLYYA